MRQIIFRKAYVARYPDPDTEIILATDDYWTERMGLEFDKACLETNQLVQGWYSDDYQATCLASRRKL
jgi:hypothetical protein